MRWKKTKLVDGESLLVGTDRWAVRRNTCFVQNSARSSLACPTTGVMDGAPCTATGVACSAGFENPGLVCVRDEMVWTPAVSSSLRHRR